MARVSTPIFYRHIDQVVAKAELHITNPRNRSNRISSRHGTSNCQLRLRCDGGSLLSIWNRVFTNQTSYPCTRTDTPSRNRSSGSLCHFAYVTQQGCKVLPAKSLLRRSLRVAQYRALPVCQLLETHANGDGTFAARKDDCESAIMGGHWRCGR